MPPCPARGSGREHMTLTNGEISGNGGLEAVREERRLGEGTCRGPFRAYSLPPQSAPSAQRTARPSAVPLAHWMLVVDLTSGAEGDVVRLGRGWHTVARREGGRGEDSSHKRWVPGRVTGSH